MTKIYSDVSGWRNTTTYTVQYQLTPVYSSLQLSGNFIAVNE
jgi:hypothetical protein